MSRWGIGVIFAPVSLAYGMFTLALTYIFKPLFNLDFIPSTIRIIIGLLFLVIGIPFFISSVVAVSRAYNADKLVCSGIFRCSRHPLYASWVFFLVPGIVFLCNSWIGLTTPLFMYILLKNLVRKEEIYLENRFGSKYIEYKKKTPCILPIGFLYKIR